jgi:hypothetical protein
MLNCKPEELPTALSDELILTDILCNQAGGQLGSRQVIAVIIRQHQKQVHLESKMNQVKYHGNEERN